MSSITDLLNSSDDSLYYTPKQISGFIQGTVTENNNSEFPGMVKVQFTALEDKFNIFEWVPVISPYAGKEYGKYTMPEVDDIVIIGFINGDFQKPFVLGSIFPDAAKIPKDSTEKNNYKKSMLTKGGISVELNDEKDKQSITVKTPKELTAIVSDEKEEISVSDKDGKNKISINVKNNALLIQADASIELKCGKVDIKLDGKGGECAIKCSKLTVTAEQTAKISSNQQLNLEGGMLKINGKQTLSAQGGTMTEIKGGMVKIN